jgi:OOP family OmpA-OmpF porin
MKRWILAGAATAALAFCAGTSANAAQPDGWYGAVDLGYHQPMNNSNQFGTGVQYKGDYSAFVRGGYRIAPNWRVEVEGGYRPSSDKGRYLGGHSDTETAMANVIYDFFPDAKWQPFIGIGAGAVRQDLHEDGLLGTLLSHRVSVAGQAIAGLSYAASDQLNVDLTYRYIQSDKFDVTCVGQCVTPQHYKDYQDNSVTIGLRYLFAAPPPPPPPPPPPFDQFILTPEAQTVVQQASQYANDGHATRVVVVGHTDTSGSVAYNLRLSERRAKAVADALVGLGVPQTVMNVDWKGKSDLAVQTPDGTKEPLNRRSTISINF